MQAKAIERQLKALSKICSSRGRLVLKNLFCEVKENQVRVCATDGRKLAVATYSDLDFVNVVGELVISQKKWYMDKSLRVFEENKIGKYPNVDLVLPNIANFETPTKYVAFNPEYLNRLSKVYQAFGGEAYNIGLYLKTDDKQKVFSLVMDNLQIVIMSVNK